MIRRAVLRHVKTTRRSMPSTWPRASQRSSPAYDRESGASIHGPSKTRPARAKSTPWFRRLRARLASSHSTSTMGVYTCIYRCQVESAAIPARSRATASVSETSAASRSASAWARAAVRRRRLSAARQRFEHAATFLAGIGAPQWAQRGASTRRSRAARAGCGATSGSGEQDDMGARCSPPASGCAAGLA